MPILRKTFSQGRMNLDIENRMFPDGDYREATNVVVLNNENGQEGSVRKLFSNKQITNLDLGENPIYLGGYAQNSRNRVFMRFLSDSGAYLVEHDFNTNTSTFVLKDTRPIGSRVFELDANYFCTAINIISNEEKNDELILMTDNNIEPLCFNIERAKTWSENGFEKEDIYLIKAPPRYAPNVYPTTIDAPSNNIEEKLLTYFYRYKFWDGEYSALSSPTNYKFSPKNFELDYFTLENIGMVNSFNAVTIEFNTGGRQVTDIEIIFKYSNSNALYRIEKFNKEILGWGNNQTKDFVFSNNKSYSSLPEKELFRSFDNVPRKALAQTVIENILIYGNYLENFNMIDAEENKIKMDYEVSFVSEPIDNEVDFTCIVDVDTFFKITNPSNIPLKQGGRFIISLYATQKDDTHAEYSNTWDGVFFFFLQEDYASLQTMVASVEFQEFIDSVKSNFVNNWEYTIPTNQEITTPPELQIYYSSSISGIIINITPATFTNIVDSLTHIVTFKIKDTSGAGFSKSDGGSTCKTNRDYEVGFSYLDPFGRKTTTITSLKNTVYIPQLYSSSKNKLKITIPPTQLAPAFADRFKIVVKTPALTYENVYINKFYNDQDNFYVWCKLEGDNKDKVQKNDVLIVKKAPEQKPEIIKVKVLDIKEQDKNFLVSLDQNGNQIPIEAGLYMKIRPNGFSMDLNDYKVYQNNYGDIGKYVGFPVGYLNLFTTIDGSTFTDLPITTGTSIKISINSSRYYKSQSGWSNGLYEPKEYYATNDYDSIEDWFNENFIGKNHYLNTTPSGELKNYGPNVELVRGFVTYEPNISEAYGYYPVFQADSNGKLYLKTTGLYAGNGASLDGKLRASIVVRTTTGFYVFETEEKQADSEIFFETEETFDIVNGYHQGNKVNQTGSVAAEIELDFFNCFAQGQGIESYKVKDGFNKPYLNIDTRPNAKSDEEYKENRRIADLTYSEPYNDSSNFNGLNVFNLSQGNWKDDIDKQYGSIQIIQSRENDIVVLQEDKPGKVFFNKNAIYSADGEATLTTTKNILGEYDPYAGSRGIGLNPESFSMDDFGRIKYASARNGTIVRLSLDGVEDINYGIRTYLRSLFIANPNAKIFSGFDPYLDLTVFSFKDEIKTISHSEGNKGWTSFWGYFPDGMLRLNNFFLTIKNGQLWQHNDVDNPNMNIIYGEQLISSIKTVINESMYDDKIFKTIVEESDEKWKAILTTNLTNGEIKENEFNTRESRQFAYIRGNEASNSLRGNAAQGIGNIIAINGTEIEFSVIPDLISVGDVLFQSDSGIPEEIGVIDAIDKESKTFIINTIVTAPTIGFYCYAKKNSRIEGEEMRGYYLEVELINDNTTNGELFGVSTNAIKSHV